MATRCVGPPVPVEQGQARALRNPQLPASDAQAWGELLAAPEDVWVCGCLDDPNPVCIPPPLPGE